ncbi:MAG: LysR family transcriptional regulator [Burkholderiales bacterium]|nr:LysR family transcriptional regulator [Burkholderiales bacterium]
MSTDLQLLDSRWLLLLDMLYRTHSVTRAAEQLGVSQPTLSIWLAQARQALNDPLFVRTPSGMQATPRTEGMMATVRSVLAGLRLLTEVVEPFDPARVEREFRIFMTDASHITLLPRLFSHVRALAPRVRLEAITIHPAMVQALESGDADLGLGLIPGLESGFYQQALFIQDWICIANARHPRLLGSLSLADYERESHVGIVAGTGQLLLETAMKEQGIERRVALKLPGFLGLPAILSTTDLLATLPRQIGETLAAAAGLQLLPCPLSVPTFVVKQHWHARFHQDPANRWLRGICAELFMDATRIKSADAA